MNFKKRGTFFSYYLVLNFLIKLCLCHQPVVSNDNDDDVCLAAASSVTADCKTENFEIRIPPSWVNYLHNYEQAKLNHAKACKEDVSLENVSINCNYAKTIQDDLKIFTQIR